MSAGPSRNLLPADAKVTLDAPGSSSSKNHILKPDNEQPWTANTLPSSIHITLPTPVVNATHIALTFQGGFVGTQAMVYVATKSKRGESEVDLGLMMGGRIYPEDKNKRQIFEIPFPQVMDAAPINAQNLPTQEHDEDTGAKIKTEVPPNPSGGGAAAESLVDDQGDGTPLKMTQLKIEFEASSDQFGRITVYQVELLG